MAEPIKSAPLPVSARVSTPEQAHTLLEKLLEVGFKNEQIATVDIDSTVISSANLPGVYRATGRRDYADPNPAEPPPPEGDYRHKVGTGMLVNVWPELGQEDAVRQVLRDFGAELVEPPRQASDHAEDDPGENAA